MGKICFDFKPAGNRNLSTYSLYKLCKYSLYDNDNAFVLKKSNETHQFCFYGNAFCLKDDTEWTGLAKISVEFGRRLDTLPAADILTDVLREKEAWRPPHFSYYQVFLCIFH